MEEIESDQLQSASHEEAKFKKEDEEGEDECTLQFLDSLDAYLTLVDSLSSSLRQGWFDLASARQSMGHTRISSKLFDHKAHSASTTVKVTELHIDNLSDGEKSIATEVEAQASTAISSDIQKERSKSSTLFGAMVSPKLRTAQVSFETALDKIVEMANARSSILTSFSQLELKKKSPS
ncbi:coiled-coil domain-containing protein 115 [Carex littledalei]|uniref:Vacuolar ATPase assembly protein VMA22 n=1 Tax=Carex littledalei TaxID=544730 RepID=A0A833R5M8_9POAL|nr:coiled-coil domain-containing protein 115 [Carex littledalei]